MTTDKKLIQRRFEANFEHYNALAHVQQQICGQLASAIASHRRMPFLSGYEVGAGTGFLTRHLVEEYPLTRWVFNDLSPAAAPFLDPLTGGLDACYLWGDAEELPFPDAPDIVASASTVQWFGDLSRFVRRASQAMRPGAMLALSTFGPGNFVEILRLTGQGLEYHDEPQLRTIMQRNGFSVEYFHDYSHTLWFDTPLEVLHHIRATGVNSLSVTPWTKGRLVEFEHDYTAHFAGSGHGRLPLTYNPVLIVAHRTHRVF